MDGSAALRRPSRPSDAARPTGETLSQSDPTRNRLPGPHFPTATGGGGEDGGGESGRLHSTPEGCGRSVASAFKEPQLVTVPSGIQFSPALAGQRGGVRYSLAGYR